MTTPSLAAAMWPVLEVYALRTYRLERFELMNANVLDIGAHVGAFSLAICSTYRGSTTTAFEPTPETFQYLTRNIAQNDLAARITPVNAAVSSRGGPVTFHIGGYANSTNSILGDPSQATINVPSMALEAVLTREKRGFDVCKMDCEGAEYDLIEATPLRAWDRVRLILLEFHPVPGRKSSALISRIGSLGFRLVLQEDYAASGMAWFSR